MYQKNRHRASKLINGLEKVLKDVLSNNDEIVSSLFLTAEVSSENRSKLVNYFRVIHVLRFKDLEKLKGQIKQLDSVGMHSHDIGTSIV